MFFKRLIFFSPRQSNLTEQRTDTQTDLCLPKMKFMNTSSSEEVTSKTSLCPSRRNPNMDSPVTLLLYRCVRACASELLAHLKKKEKKICLLFGLIFSLVLLSSKSSLGGSSAGYHPRWSPYRDVMPTYNQLAASSLLSQQYNAALGFGNAFYFIFSACFLSIVGPPPQRLFLCLLHQDFTASRPEEFPWWSRLSRRHRWPTLPKEKGEHQRNHRAGSLCILPSARLVVFPKCRRRIYPPVC